MIARACLLAFVVGCGGQESYTRSSERVAAPAGGPWTGATASIRFEPYRYGAHASMSEHVVLALELDGATPTKLVLDDAYRGDEPGDTPAAAYEQLLAPAFDLRFAPDGHALAVSIDGGTTFRPVLFDLGAPMFCRHESIAAAALWEGAPSSRQIVLDVLASADPPVETSRPHLEPGEYPRARERFIGELAVARAFACSHPEDAELRAALVAALLRHGSQLFGTSTIMPLIACVGSLARDHVELRAPLVAALGADPRRGDAAMALAESASADVQHALASAMPPASAACGPTGAERNEVRCSDERYLRFAFGGALALVSTRLGTVTPEVTAVALALLGDDDARNEIQGVRMLALSSDAAARTALTGLAAGECPTPIAWSDVYEGGSDESPACWAKAALSR